MLPSCRRGNTMTRKDQGPVEDALDKVDEGRRASLRTIAAGTAFIVPLVASFSTDGLHFNMAEAGGLAGNQTVGPHRSGHIGPEAMAGNQTLGPQDGFV